MSLEQHGVPLGWVLWLLGVVCAGIISLVVWAFRRNESAHGTIWRGLRRVHQRIDHLIHHSRDIPEYDDNDDQDDQDDQGRRL